MDQPLRTSGYESHRIHQESAETQARSGGRIVRPWIGLQSESAVACAFALPPQPGGTLRGESGQMLAVYDMATLRSHR